jgi:hypothetical protein
MRRVPGAMARSSCLRWALGIYCAFRRNSLYPNQNQTPTDRKIRLLPTGCIGYAKRAVTSTGVTEGAHEYIAAELAHLIGVPVPPVGFCHDNAGRHFSLSVRAFDEAVHWGEIPLSEAEHDFLRPVFSASAVLHAWIGDIDHAAHPQNLMIDADSPEGQPRVAFIDHAMSLTAAWKPGDAPASLPQEYYIEPNKFLRESVSTTLQKVQGVSQRVLESMISRVPQAHASTAKRAAILECLRGRANELQAAFAKTPGGR